MTQASSPRIRLYVTQPLHDAARIELSEPQAHYAGSVMRLKEGDRVALFNGSDGEWQANIVELRKRALICECEHQLQPQRSVPDLWLCFAPIKHGRIDWLVEKATELGVSQLLPVLTERTIVSRVNVPRLQAHAVEAAEQSGRLDVPQVFEPQKFEALLGAWDGNRTLIYADESGAGGPALERLGAQKNRPLALFIGPEGGFSRGEHQMLQRHPHATGIGLGPRVMRADTAALAALTLVQAQCGDWHHPPAFAVSA